MAAAIDGPVHVTEDCVLLEEPENEVLLVWPVDRVTWVAQSETVVWHSVEGDPVVTLTEGDQVVLSGGGSSAVVGGQSGAQWVEHVRWINPPAPSCPIDAGWIVSDVTEISHTAPQPSPPPNDKPPIT